MSNSSIKSYYKQKERLASVAAVPVSKYSRNRNERRLLDKQIKQFNKFLAVAGFDKSMPRAVFKFSEEHNAWACRAFEADGVEPFLECWGQNIADVVEQIKNETTREFLGIFNKVDVTREPEENYPANMYTINA